MLISPFLRIPLFLPTRSRLVRGRMMICAFIPLPRKLLLLFHLRQSLLSLKSMLGAYTPPVPSPPPAASTSDPVLNDDLPIALCKGKRQCTHPISSFCSYNHLSSHSCSFIASLDAISSPNKVSKALAHPGWRSAMIEEKDDLTDNGTWDLVRLATEKKVIGCQWVFTLKVNPDGSIARLKACLVAKGYAQTYGVDYSYTHSYESSAIPVKTPRFK